MVDRSFVFLVSFAGVKELFLVIIMVMEVMVVVPVRQSFDMLGLSRFVSSFNFSFVSISYSLITRVFHFVLMIYCFFHFVLIIQLSTRFLHFLRVTHSFFTS